MCLKSTREGLCIYVLLYIENPFLIRKPGKGVLVMDKTQ